MKRALLVLLALVVAGCAGNPSDSDATGGTVYRLYFLGGQSNMEGHGFIKADPKRNGGKGSLEYVARDMDTADKFKHLVGKDGKWAAARRPAR